METLKLYGQTYTKNDNGDQFWYLNGERHREDGPAIEWADGDKVWYLNGERHREDGPAIEWADGYKAWYLDGKQLTESEFNNRMNKSCSSKKCKDSDRDRH